MNNIIKYNRKKIDEPLLLYNIDALCMLLRLKKGVVIMDVSSHRYYDNDAIIDYQDINIEDYKIDDEGLHNGENIAALIKYINYMREERDLCFILKAIHLDNNEDTPKIRLEFDIEE